MKAFLTGASSGIGEALARLLAAKKYTLFLSGRNETRLQSLANELKADYIVAELPAQLDRLVEVVQRELPDLIINCAGFAIYGDMLSTSVHEQMDVLEVNASAPIQLTLEAARALLDAQKRGIILNVSSIAGEHLAPGMGLYGPAKACLTHFSQILNSELAHRGIHVLVSCPGMVATDFANRAAKKKVTYKGGPAMTPEYAAKQIWQQIERRQEKRIFNWFYRVIVYWTPESLIKKMIRKNIQKRL